ncbi:GatB/YqeY domain-containing protein [Gallaecimonas xiamenensis]|uniref:GatB/YqeY domain-containing protein n=1 Tax=Gallaecimonas xiamenensis 3-C-1 TaxID=745411 RepID=K2J5C2_9GAMM|nr:GatB/YqeY domain-containing protein [Gallaecimonas xiamenensis]EKE70233.1 GatB/YqeY domain-containing protein [Gallaecimonas xiamenensis 3-C-1]
MSLKEQLTDAQKDAMRAKDKLRLGTLRLTLSAIKQVEVDERRELSDDDVIAIITKMIKQRRDSISQYENAGRQELADAEAAEIVVLQDFLPKQLSGDEIAALIEQAITATGAAGPADMGKVMGWLKPKLQGRAEIGPISGQVKAKLSA